MSNPNKASVEEIKAGTAKKFQNVRATKGKGMLLYVGGTTPQIMRVGKYRRALASEEGKIMADLDREMFEMEVQMEVHNFVKRHT